MKSTKTLAILNLLGFIGTIIVNGLANALPINGVNTGELSDLYPNLFVPAGLTFSIWGIIYLLLGMFVVVHLVRAFGQNKDNQPFTEGIGIWFFISSLANMAWIFAWHYKLVVLSLVIMLVILGSLTKIYLSLPIGRPGASNSNRYLIHLPFSIYLGWIMIATVANVTTLLVDSGFGGLGISEVVWTVIVMAVALGLAIYAQFDRGDIFLSLVTIWAFFGIYLKRSAQAAPETAIIYTALIGIGLLVVGAIVAIIRKKGYFSVVA